MCVATVIGLHGEETMPSETERYMNDDGTEFNPNLIPLPDLCVVCMCNEGPASES
ncbi:MAG: hypothetical protein GWP14_10110 [Actinobacteria bacterium]|nr:hypothetical protein [Actinomycetota bacterium]